MKIQLSHLRRIIKETLDEQGWVPGRWYPKSAGEPLSSEDKERIANGGWLSGDELDEDDVEEEVSHVHLDEIKQFVRIFLEGPAGPGVAADPTNVKGFYPYDLERGTDIHQFWYRSPGRGLGADGDPGRPSDAAEYIGFKTKGTKPEDAATEAEPPPVVQK